MAEIFNDAQITELASRRLWRPLLRLRLMDEASAGFAPEPEEATAAWESFCKKNQIDPATVSYTHLTLPTKA